MTTVAIQDANVIIDLCNGGILDTSLLLDFDFHVADVVVEEIKDETQMEILRSAIESGKITVDETSSETALEAMYLINGTRAISYEDAVSILLAESLGGILLTGDGNLRKRSFLRKLEVRGTLWIFDLLVVQGFLSPQEAANALRLVTESNKRLPRMSVPQGFMSGNRNHDPHHGLIPQNLPTSAGGIRRFA